MQNGDAYVRPVKEPWQLRGGIETGGYQHRTLSQREKPFVIFREQPAGAYQSAHKGQPPQSAVVMAAENQIIAGDGQLRERLRTVAERDDISVRPFPQSGIDCLICFVWKERIMGKDIDDLIYGSTETVPSDR